MPWTTPKTWVNSEPLTAVDLNTHLRDNLNALHAPPSAAYQLNETANYTTTSTTFVNVDNTDGKLSLTLTTTGGAVMIGFFGYAYASGNTGFLDVELDGTRIGGDDGLVVFYNNIATTSFVLLKTGLSAGSHTFKLQWKVAGGGTATLYAGAGTIGADVHPQFWVREVS
jgi:hypothetical protein